ncbi:hypothetical protein [Sphingomonas sp. 28-63-12]|uniref:hypothetical protein n=1 Tax=Sphingomonas sp. 28-63-12 TaxID=1970434 RepID=UPI000BDBA3C3|nr:MAG: hypothetical protein B7Y47_10935 [Sphingomonas sp. 28-63-12]
MLHSPIILGSTGYRPTYQVNNVNNCPSCARSHWLVGRIMAECAFCGAALPIAHESHRPVPQAA